MLIRGRALKYGNNINTDLILPGRYLHIYDPRELAEHAMEDLDPDFPEKFTQGDILVAGNNFGCGSSREQAAICLKYAGVGTIIAGSFARIFFRNAMNQGIPIITADTDQIATGDELEVHPETGEIKNMTKGKVIQGEKIPEFLMDLIKDGGLIPHLKKTL